LLSATCHTHGPHLGGTLSRHTCIQQVILSNDHRSYDLTVCSVPRSKMRLTRLRPVLLRGHDACEPSCRAHSLHVRWPGLPLVSVLGLVVPDHYIFPRHSLSCLVSFFPPATASRRRFHFSCGCPHVPSAISPLFGVLAHLLRNFARLLGLLGVLAHLFGTFARPSYSWWLIPSRNVRLTQARTTMVLAVSPLPGTGIPYWWRPSSLEAQRQGDKVRTSSAAIIMLPIQLCAEKDVP